MLASKAVDEAVSGTPKDVCSQAHRPQSPVHITQEGQHGLLDEFVWV